MEDIRETGPMTGKQLKQEIASLQGQSMSLQDYQNFIGSGAAMEQNFYPAYNEAEPVLIGNSRGEDIPFGKSKYDKNATSLADYIYRNDRRGNLQPWYAQLGAGLGKMLTTAGTTFISSTLGTVYGIGAGIAEVTSGDKDKSFLHGFTQNAISKTMTDWSKKMESVLPNYYTDYERQAPWYNKLLTMNFWADGIIKNAGFTIGAAAAATAWACVPGINALNGLGLVGMLAKGALGSIGEANMESINGVDELEKNYKNLTDQISENQKKEAENKYLQALYAGEDYDTIRNEYENTLSKIDADKEALLSNPEYQKSLIEAGNSIFGWNVALLTLTNTFELSNLIRGGYTMAQLIEKNAIKAIESTTGKDLAGTALGRAFKDKTLQYTANALERPGLNFAGRTLATGISEGVIEEGGQNLVSTAKQIYATSKWRHTPLAAYLDTEDLPIINSRAEAFQQALKDQYGSAGSEGWNDVVMGFIGGVIGAPFLGKKSNGKFGFQWVGGMKNAYDETIGVDKQTKEALDKLNAQIHDEKFIDKYFAAVGLMQSDREMIDALNKGDKAAFKLEEFRQVAEQVNLWNSMGKLDDLIDIYKGVKESFSDEDVALLKRATGQNFDGETNEQIISEFKDKADTTLAKIDAYRNSMTKSRELLQDANFLTTFAEYLDDPVTSTIVLNNIAFNDANITELNRRKAKIQSQIDSFVVDETVNNTAELTQLKQDLASIEKQLQKTQGLDYVKNHLEEVKEDYDKFFEMQRKIAIGSEVDKAVERLSKAETIQDIADNFQYLKPEIAEQVITEAKAKVSPEIQSLIDKYDTFTKTFANIQSKIEEISNADNSSVKLEDSEKQQMQQILSTELNAAAQRIIKTLGTNLSKNELKQAFSELIDQDYLQNAAPRVAQAIQDFASKVLEAIDAAEAVVTAPKTATQSVKPSENCKYESVDSLVPEIATILKNFLPTDALMMMFGECRNDFNEAYDTGFGNIPAKKISSQAMYDECVEYAKKYQHTHKDAVPQDIVVAVARDILYKYLTEPMQIIQAAILVAQVVTDSAAKETENNTQQNKQEPQESTPQQEEPQTTQAEAQRLAQLKAEEEELERLIAEEEAFKQGEVLRSTQYIEASRTPEIKEMRSFIESLKSLQSITRTQATQLLDYEDWAIYLGEVSNEITEDEELDLLEQISNLKKKFNLEYISVEAKDNRLPNQLYGFTVTEEVTSDLPEGASLYITMKPKIMLEGLLVQEGVVIRKVGEKKSVQTPKVVTPVLTTPTVKSQTQPTQSSTKQTTSTQTQPKTEKPTQPTDKVAVLPSHMSGDIFNVFSFAQNDITGVEMEFQNEITQKLSELGINTDLMRTKYMRFIQPGIDGTPIHFVALPETQSIPTKSRPYTITFLAVNVNDLPKDVVDDRDISNVKEINGQRYLLIGTYGFNGQEEAQKASGNKQWKYVTNKLAQQMTETGAVLDMVTYVKNISYGKVVIGHIDKNNKNTNEVTYYPQRKVSELFEPATNPFGYDAESIQFYMKYEDGIEHISSNINSNDILWNKNTQNDRDDRGKLFILVPGIPAGKWIPIKVNPITLNEAKETLEANTKYVKRIKEALKAMVNPEFANDSLTPEQVRQSFGMAKADLARLLYFKDTANLDFLTNENYPMSIAFLGADGGVIDNVIDLTKVTPENREEMVEKLYNAILALDNNKSPLINFKGSEITDPDYRTLYFGTSKEQCLVTTNVKSLACEHPQFTVYAFDETMKGYNTSVSSSAGVKEKTSTVNVYNQVINLNDTVYKYNPVTGKVYIDNQEIVGEEAENVKELLNAINSGLREGNVTIKIGNTVQTYLSYNNKLWRIANKSYSLVDAEQAKNILAKAQRQTQAKQVDNTAANIMSKIAEEAQPSTTQTTETPKQAESEQVTTTSTDKLDEVAQLLNKTKEEVESIITANDACKQKAKVNYIPLTSPLANVLIHRIATQAKGKINRYGIYNFNGQVQDALQAIIDFMLNPENAEFLKTEKLENETAINIMLRMYQRRPDATYDKEFTQEDIKRMIEEMLHCK